MTQFEFAARNYDSLIARHNPANAAGKLVEDVASDHMKATTKAVARAPLSSTGFPVLEGLPDPTLALYSPSTHIGAVSEAFAFQLGDYTAKNAQRLLKVKKKHRADWKEWEGKQRTPLVELESFKIIMAMRYMHSLVDPGEAVGLLASQGVGEPSTQMTLNTFHFAGHGAANVTLGIPRLREIVMTASANIKTPTMKFEVQPQVTDEALEHFCKESSKVTLSQVIEEVTVDERLSSKHADNAFSREKLYTIRMRFYPRAEYEEEFRTSPEQILRSFGSAFVPAFDKEVSKAFKTTMKGAKLSDVGKAQKTGLSGDPKNMTETGEDVEAGDAQGAFEDDMAAPRRSDVDENDGDADDARRAKQGAQDATYDESDSEDDDLGMPKDSEALDAAFADDSASEKDDDEADSDVGSEDIDESGDVMDKRRAKMEEKDRQARMAELEARIAGRSRYIQGLEFDKVNGEWCTMELQVGRFWRAPPASISRLTRAAIPIRPTSSPQSSPSCSLSALSSGAAGTQSCTRHQASPAV